MAAPLIKSTGEKDEGAATTEIKLWKNNYSAIQAILSKDPDMKLPKNGPTDILAKLLVLSDDANLRDVMRNYHCFESIFEQNSHALHHFMTNCHIKTQMSSEVVEANWRPTKRQVLFNSATSMLSAEQIIVKIDEVLDNGEWKTPTRTDILKYVKKRWNKLSDKQKQIRVSPDARLDEDDDDNLLLDPAQLMKSF